MEASWKERKGTEPLDDSEKEKDGDGDWEPGKAYKRIDVGHLKNAEGLTWVSTQKRAGSAPAHFRCKSVSTREPSDTIEREASGLRTFLPRGAPGNWSRGMIFIRNPVMYAMIRNRNGFLKR